MEKKNTSKALNITLWVVQVLVATLFLYAGSIKSTQPIEDLAKGLPWVKDFPLATVRFIGISELLGGIGLLLPALLRIKPILTPLAGLALFVVMVFAMVYHITKGEYNALGSNAVIAGLALFIAWGRYKKAPITERI